MLAGVFPAFFLGCFCCRTRCGIRDRGLRRLAGHPWAGGWVTLRAADAGDWDLGLEIIPGDTVGFCCSLMGMGCVCEGAHGHPQLPGCLSLSPNQFLSLSLCCSLFPFLAKYLCLAQGKSSGFRRPVSHRQECLGMQGFPLGKQMFLQQLKFCKKLPPARRGRSR